MAMNVQFVTSSYFLKDIPIAILNKREIIKLKMQRYKDVKVYLYSFILPDYMTDEYVSEQLDALASHLHRTCCSRISYYPSPIRQSTTQDLSPIT